MTIKEKIIEYNFKHLSITVLSGYSKRKFTGLISNTGNLVRKLIFLLLFLHVVLEDSRLGDIITHLIYHLICFIILGKMKPCL